MPKDKMRGGRKTAVVHKDVMQTGRRETGKQRCVRNK